jgi:hypothetical protein
MSMFNLQLVIGAAGFLVLFGPAAWGAGKRLLSSGSADPSPSGHGDSVVGSLSALMRIRRQVKSDPKALEAIDTLITPALIRSGDQANES